MGELRTLPELRGRTRVFADRADAGRVLARWLEPEWKGAEGGIVLAVPAGGVPVGLELARGLELPLDLIFVRKLHFPDNPEAGFGALGEGGVLLIDPDAERWLGPEEVRAVVAEERRALAERIRRLRGPCPPPRLAGRRVLLTDDGLASGASMRVAVREARARGAEQVEVAVPTASSDAARRVAREADRVFVANLRSGPPFAVADAYRNWRDLSTEEVAALLHPPRTGGA